MQTHDGKVVRRPDGSLDMDYYSALARLSQSEQVREYMRTAVAGVCTWVARRMHLGTS